MFGAASIILILISRDCRIQALKAWLSFRLLGRLQSTVAIVAVAASLVSFFGPVLSEALVCLFCGLQGMLAMSMVVTTDTPHCRVHHRLFAGIQDHSLPRCLCEGPCM